MRVFPDGYTPGKIIGTRLPYPPLVDAYDYAGLPTSDDYATEVLTYLFRLEPRKLVGHGLSRVKTATPPCHLSLSPKVFPEQVDAENREERLTTYSLTATVQDSPGQFRN